MSVIDKRFPRGCYYVFSDDLSWCRDNLRFKGEGVFVDVNAGKPALDGYAADDEMPASYYRQQQF